MIRRHRRKEMARLIETMELQLHIRYTPFQVSLPLMSVAVPRSMACKLGNINILHICNFPWHGPFPVSTGVLGSCNRPAHDQCLEKATFYTFPCCLRYYFKDKQEGQDYILSLFLFLRPSHCCPGFAGFLFTTFIIVSVHYLHYAEINKYTRCLHLKSLPSFSKHLIQSDRLWGWEGNYDFLHF